MMVKNEVWIRVGNCLSCLRVPLNEWGTFWRTPERYEVTAEGGRPTIYAVIPLEEKGYNIKDALLREHTSLIGTPLYTSMEGGLHHGLAWVPEPDPEKDLIKYNGGFYEYIPAYASLKEVIKQCNLITSRLYRPHRDVSITLQYTNNGMFRSFAKVLSPLKGSTFYGKPAGAIGTRSHASAMLHLEEEYIKNELNNIETWGVVDFATSEVLNI